MSNTIVVSNIGLDTLESTVRYHFSLSKIKEFELKKDGNDRQIAFITFENKRDVDTALVYDGTFMDTSKINVRPLNRVGDNDDTYSENDEKSQLEAKSNIDILAEILAAGYQLQETIIEKGSGIDAKLGVSERFSQYLTQLTAKLQELDRKYKLTETVVHKASEIDNKYSVKDTVLSKATQVLDTEPGKYAQELYNTTYNQIGVIQCQARKIANAKKSEGNGGIEAH
ncbi:6661_t:CDS:2 [Acaulospora colombiana]|uniref:6661_t:CDS:1 n=1 Tax=Acaulospora colombiana TaxID=27376 RepID=A0ACA9KYG0_9GLOM|nr:6661_t:CDS:2 [Acaulospora colombiana]